VDVVIPAVSQYADLPFIKKSDIGVTPWGTFITDSHTKMTTMKGVFAGGDVARGPDEVIRAIADGKQAAVSIDLFLGGTGKLNKGRTIDIPQSVDDDEVLIHNRFPQDCLPVDSRTKNFDEVLLGYHKLNAIAESMRCLHCDRR
jgi:NADH-quinone oxidoreductase subunit F